MKRPASEAAHTARQPSKDAGRRGPGRPKGQVDREALLIDAALTLFAAHGIANTTLRMIAESVGLTPAMAHYYFNSRDELIEALLRERLFPVCARIAEVADGTDRAAIVAALIQRIMEAAARHPWLAPLWVREMLPEGGALTARVHLWLGEAGSETWARIVRRWQRQGLTSPDIEPSLVFTSLMALTLMPIASGWDATDPARHARLTAHVTALLRGGL